MKCGLVEHINAEVNVRIDELTWDFLHIDVFNPDGLLVIFTSTNENVNFL